MHAPHHPLRGVGGASHTQHSATVEKRLGEHAARLHEVEIALAGASPRIGMNEWLARLIIGGVIGAVMWVLRGSLGAKRVPSVTERQARAMLAACHDAKTRKRLQ